MERSTSTLEIPTEPELRLRGLYALHTWLHEQRLTLSWLAREIGTSRQALSQWRSIPERHIDQIVRVTGMSIAELRPDIADVVQRHRIKRRSRAA